MLRKSMIALCAAASFGMLAPDMALARGPAGMGGHSASMGGNSAGMSSSFGRGAGGGNWGHSTRNFSNSLARATPNVSAGAVQGNRFAGNRFAGANFNHERGFRHGFRDRDGFVVGGFFGPGFYDDYWDYPDYAYNDYYYDDGCYIVHRRVHTPYGWRIRPVQVCG